MMLAVMEDGHAEEIYCSLESTGTSGVARRDRQARRVVDESATGSDSVEGRCGRSQLDGPTNRRSVQLSDQDRREYSATIGDPRLRGNARPEIAPDAAPRQASRRQTG